MGVILDTNALSAVADDEPAVVRIYRQAARELIAATRVLVVEEET